MSGYLNIRPVAWIAGPKKKPELARLQWSATLAPHDVGRGYVVTPLVTAESAQAEITRLTAEAAELRRERDEAAEVTKRWRSLALQVDLHRMQAVWHLNALIVSPGHADAARGFLATPPTPGAEIAAKLDGLTAERDELVRQNAELAARPASAAAPERAEPAGGCADRVSCPRGER